MTRRSRAEMIEETRAKLLATARHAFGTRGYANTSMDDFTAEAGLTRGALYHHFGDKKGLLAAVVDQIDEEMDLRLKKITDTTPDAWEGFRNRCRAYLEMAQEPEIQRIALQDARAVLGGSSMASQQNCTQSLKHPIADLMAAGILKPANPEAISRLLYGSLVESAFWIAQNDTDQDRLSEALTGFDLLLQGLRTTKSA